MRLRFFLGFLALRAFAGVPSNAITITDTSGSLQTNRPVTFGRYFA